MESLTKDRVFDVVAANADRLRALGVRSLGLFGSHARGDAGPESDLDFVVEFERKSFDDYMDTKFLLEDLFHRHVDLVPLDRIKPRLRDAILAEVVRAPGLQG